MEHKPLDDWNADAERAWLVVGIFIGIITPRQIAVGGF